MLLPQECALTQRAGEDCPNVIKFFDGKMLELEGARMVMMDGALQGPESSSTDLETFVKRQGQGGLSERVAKFIFRQLDSAVHHCHVKSIRHGDITPQNVLLELAWQQAGCSWSMSGKRRGSPCQTTRTQYRKVSCSVNVFF